MLRQPVASGNSKPAASAHVVRCVQCIGTSSSSDETEEHRLKRERMIRETAESGKMSFPETLECLG